MNNFGAFSGGYFHKVNQQLDAGAKVTYDTKAATNVLEVGSKYTLDANTFVKV